MGAGRTEWRLNCWRNHSQCRQHQPATSADEPFANNTAMPTPLVDLPSFVDSDRTASTHNHKQIEGQNVMEQSSQKMDRQRLIVDEQKTTML